MPGKHGKGALTTAKGTVNEGVGKLTGARKLEAKGKVQKVGGKVQSGLADAQGRGRLQPIAISAVAAVIVVVAGVLTGWLRMGRGRG